MEFLFKNLFQSTNLSIYRSVPPPHGSVSFDTKEHVDAGACAVALAYATSEKWGFFGGSVDICSKGFTCRESCYVNRQVCILK